MKKRPKRFCHYIGSDPEVCHGSLVFVGTRILVKDVLDMVAEGMTWEAIVKEWRGDISREAIREALRLAERALREHADQYAGEPASG